MQWYTTFEQMPPTPPMMSDARWVRALLVKTVADPSSVAGAVRRVMQGSSDRIAFVDVRPYRDLIDPRTRSWRLGATLFSAFGGLALAIATVGMYAVFAYAAAQRSHEMGVRMALGARRADVARLVIGRSLRAVAAGIALGGAASLWAARYIEDLLFETGARDPGVLVTVASLLAAVALIASALPAWRAARTDPKVSLAES
jgi:ABC-type antimicrobial peptide transport system permease subunit